MRISETDTIKEGISKQRDEGEITLNDREYMPSRTLYASDECDDMTVELVKLEGNRRKTIFAKIVYNTHHSCQSQSIQRVLKKWRKYNSSNSLLWFESETNPYSAPYWRHQKHKGGDDQFVCKRKFACELKKYIGLHPNMLISFGSIEDYAVEAVEWNGDYIYFG